MRTFRKLLIANRGEIATRIIRSAREMGIKTVAVYAAADSDSLHVSQADEAYRIGQEELSETYLNIDKILEVAHKAHCDAVHPGYGFMAENPAFATAIREAGLIFIGPSPEAIQLMGNKIEARKKMKEIEVPLLEGKTGTPAELLEASEKLDYPLLVKAAAGGGGKGMRIVNEPKQLKQALEATAREAKAYFGDESVYIERYLEEPRHIEIQVIGDHYENMVHLYERECSLQRRYQKIIEESPSPTLNQAVRRRMGETAVKIALGIGYYNAGTIEFLVDTDLNFYFLEMNTRIQVEHPVTEMVTGVDLVKEQIKVAAGNKLSFHQKEIIQHGHAIESRIYAEDPENNFMPSPGKMSLYLEPSGHNIRIDSGITAATEIKPLYDPMISKLVVKGESREEAIGKMLWALEHYRIHGIKNNIRYLKNLIHSDDFRDNNISTKYCDIKTPLIVKRLKEEHEKSAFPLPVIAYLLKELADTDQGSTWRQLGLWKDYLLIPVVDGENTIEAEVVKGSPPEYVFKMEGKELRAKLYHNTDHKIEFCFDETYHIAYFSERDLFTTIDIDGKHYLLSRKDILDESKAYDSVLKSGKDAGHIITSPMHGKVIQIDVNEGQQVREGDSLAIVEAMKMENVIKAFKDNTVGKIHVATGSQVSTGDVIMEMEEK
ncbi:MAG: acetyl-CoA carboxylase biotin carboxylase subunit [Bacteroidales bacterium]|nr:acetyl-CoA carboxylase biotin carboxylase subunit [Bacteroidales bacterium]MCF8333787.1 acetyl-CoA carboxylase biotin carboxylase subunit [Bacteroidales bacterium]